MSPTETTQEPLCETLLLPSEQESLLQQLCERLLYWAPVFALMVLFAQIAFLGVRPALAEKQRMDVAERGMQERLQVAEATFQEVEAQLSVRKDPIFQERLRRLRLHPPTAQ
jgi:hypothetical protein